jgi:hypothetical protein
MNTCALQGWDPLCSLTRFENYSAAMFALSCAFTSYFGAQFILHAWHKVQRKEDVRGILEYSWNAVFWAGED